MHCHRNLIGASGYGYSSENMLTSALSSATLGYDPLNRLYQTTGGGTTARFGYDGSEMIAEYNGSNTLQRRYVFGPGMDEPLVWYEGTGTSTRRYFHADEHGSVVAVSDAPGNLVGSNPNRYDEYGVSQGTLTGRFGYTGQAWIPEAALYHYRNRAYNPAMGRFMQTDPIGSQGGMNLYAYVGGNPVNATDPSGTEKVCVTAPNGRNGPIQRCVNVDQDRDKDGTDHDMNEQQKDEVRGAYFDFIARFGGSSSNPTSIVEFGKPVKGDYPLGVLQRIYVASQFVGALANFLHNDPAVDRFRNAWNNIQYIEVLRHGGSSVLTMMGGGTPANPVLYLDMSGGSSSLYGSLSDIARVLLHEPWHFYYNESNSSQYQIMHPRIDNWARTMLMHFGLGGGGCHSYGGFPGC